MPLIIDALNGTSAPYIDIDKNNFFAFSYCLVAHAPRYLCMLF